MDGETSNVCPTLAAVPKQSPRAPEALQNRLLTAREWYRPDSQCRAHSKESRAWVWSGERVLPLITGNAVNHDRMLTYIVSSFGVPCGQLLNATFDQRGRGIGNQGPFFVVNHDEGEGTRCR